MDCSGLTFVYESNENCVRQATVIYKNNVRICVMKYADKGRFVRKTSVVFKNGFKKGLCRGGSGEGEAKRLAALENTNATLRQQLEDLEILTRQHHTLQRHVQEKDLECVTLKEKLKLKNELCQDLECQLARVIEKNTELTIQNSDLQKQIQELQHVSEECKTLKHTLNQVETDWSTAKVQVGSLQGKVGNLESVLRQMKEAADKRRELERQHAEALAQLREQQAAIADSSKTNQKDRKASVEVTEALQSKIRELEKKAEVQNLRHEELLLEMQSLKKAQGSPKNSWSRSGSLSADLQSPDSGDVTPGLTSLNSLSSGIYTNTTSSSLVAPGSVGLTTGSSSYPASGTVENTSSEIDRIMAKIEQDNKILAELDKSRSTIDKNLVNGNIPGVMMPPYETDNRILDVLEIPGKGRCHVYIARYSYDPFHHSPNENPEAELAVNAGDYVLVWGTMDEDGFFDGELLDGRRGLVPSNFVDKLVGEDLIEFHQSVVMGLRDGDESMSTSVPQDLDFISQDESQMMIDSAAPVKFVKNIFKGVQGLFGPGDKNGAPTLVSTVLGSTGSTAQALIPKGPVIPQPGQMKGMLNPLSSFNPAGQLSGQLSSLSKLASGLQNPPQHGASSTS